MLHKKSKMQQGYKLCHPNYLLPSKLCHKAASFIQQTDQLWIGKFCRLELLGALESKLVVEEGEGWRLVSCIWLHAGAIHLLANMLSLLFIGIRLEQEFGFCKCPTSPSWEIAACFEPSLSDNSFTVHSKKCK